MSSFPSPSFIIHMPMPLTTMAAVQELLVEIPHLVSSSRSKSAPAALSKPSPRVLPVVMSSYGAGGLNGEDGEVMGDTIGDESDDHTEPGVDTLPSRTVPKDGRYCP